MLTQPPGDLLLLLSIRQSRSQPSRPHLGPGCSAEYTVPTSHKCVRAVAAACSSGSSISAVISAGRVQIYGIPLWFLLWICSQPDHAPALIDAGPIGAAAAATAASDAAFGRGIFETSIDTSPILSWIVPPIA